MAITKLDQPQVIKEAYDEPNKALRVTLSGTIIEVAIDQSTDSIKIGDGVNLITSTAVGAKQGLDVNQINRPDAVSTPTIVNSAIVLAATEYSFVIPAGTKAVFFKSRGASTIQFSFVSGQSGTNYVTVPSKSTYSLTNLNLSSSLTTYFQGNFPAETLEIEYWS